jgi:hypothetical protein
MGINWFDKSCLLIEKETDYLVLGDLSENIIATNYKGVK